MIKLDNKKLEKYIKNAPNFNDDIINQLSDPEFQEKWLQITLDEFLDDGNADTFIRCLTYIVKARVKSAGRGEITRLAKKLKLDRSNLSEIVNGDKQPQLGTAFKLIKGLGFEYDIKIQPKIA